LGLPMPCAALMLVLGGGGARNRDMGIEQHDDMLSAVGSRHVKDDRRQLLQQDAVYYDLAFNPEGVMRQIMAFLAERRRVV
ncbi:alpha/beta hydrolase, partial [Pseudomonas syringae pv. tagetis]